MKILDTSVLVDIDRGGVADRVTKLDGEGRHAVSTVTLTELHLGVNKLYARDTERYHDAVESLERLCARVEQLPVNRRIAVDAAEIIGTFSERGEPLDDLHDVYTAATARTERCPVLTANVEHFERIEDLTVIDWSTY